MAGWSFCQGRIGRDCVQPFSMFSLQVSRCFRGAGKQLSNSLESNCFLVMRWIDILFCHGAVYFPLCPLRQIRGAKSGARVTGKQYLLFELIQSMGLWLRIPSNAFQTDAEPSIQSEEGWFSSRLRRSFHGYVLPSCLSASEMRWREKSTSCRADRVYSFDCQSYLYYKYSLVTILLIWTVCTFLFLRKSLPEAFTPHSEIWMQPSHQNKLTASPWFTVDVLWECCRLQWRRKRRRKRSGANFWQAFPQH